MQNHSLHSLNNETSLELLARQVVEGFITGLHKSPFHGFSVEFAEHRLYNTGDNIRNIDWKLYAKTDKLFTKRYEEETNLRCQFVVDTSSSMYYPDQKYNKLLFSVQSVASLIYLLKKQRDAFGLSLFNDQLYFNTAAKSTGAHQKYLFSKLESLLKEVPLNVQTAMPAALHQVAELTHKRSMVVIFSDMLQDSFSDERLSEFFESLQHLKFNKHEVIIFNVCDKEKEIAFNFSNRPYAFVDMEIGSVVKAHVSKVKSAYLEEMKAFRQKVLLKCGQYNIDLVDAGIDEGFYPVLQRYLLKRQKMQ